MQRQVEGPIPRPSDHIPRPRNHRRSLEVPYGSIVLNNAGTRREPPHLAVDLGSIDVPLDIHRMSQMSDFGWILTRYGAGSTSFFAQSEAMQTVPSWTGFNALVQSGNDNLPPQSVVDYCPVNNASPT